jgi:hypothetical protein
MISEFVYTNIHIYTHIHTYIQGITRKVARSTYMNLCACIPAIRKGPHKRVRRPRDDNEAHKNSVVAQCLILVRGAHEYGLTPVQLCRIYVSVCVYVCMYVCT